jgi:RNA methyltransferase, TrmH family
MKLIASAENPLFKSLKKWVQSSHARRKSGVSLLDGVHLVEGYLAAGLRPQELIVSESGVRDAEVQALFARHSAAPTATLADSLFHQLAATATPQGILALVATPQPDLPSAADALVLVAENLQDPGNAGALIRAAAAAGASHVLFSKGSVFAWSPRVLRAAQGAHFATQVLEEVDVLNWAQQEKARTFVALMPRADASIFELPMPPPLALVVGNEGAGVSAALAAICTPATIPMPGKLESLNAAQAATVALFEVVRRGAG